MNLDDVIAQSMSERLNDLVPDVLVNTVQFDHQEQLLEITYAELRDQGDGVGMLKTIALERVLFADEVLSIEKDLKDLIDEVVISIRNKDVLEARIKKAQQRFNPPREEDEDE